MSAKDLYIQLIDWYNADVRADIEDEDDEDITPHYRNQQSDNESEDEMEEVFEREPRINYVVEPPNRRENRFKVVMFGRDTENHTYAISVPDFTPYFYVRVPDYFTKHETGLLMGWLTETLSLRIRNFNTKYLIRANLVERLRFRGFNNFRKFKFVRFVVANLHTMRSAIKCFQILSKDADGRETPVGPASIQIDGISTKPVQYELYDTMIDPLLRYIHHQNILNPPDGFIFPPIPTPNATTYRYANIITR